MSGKTIAVIGAMEQEIKLLHERMNHAETHVFGNFTAYEGQYGGRRVILALSGIGKVNAAVSTAWVIHRFRPDCVINTGSAGGLGGGLKVGDVVIGSRVVHHDVDATVFGYEIGQVPGLPAVFEADTHLVAAAAKAAVAFEGASVREGLVASGDRFIGSDAAAAQLRRQFPDIQAVEMEAAAIAQTCVQLNTPFVVVRAVSDSADDVAGLSFDEFLQTAAVHSAEMVSAVIKKL